VKKVAFMGSTRVYEIQHDIYVVFYIFNYFDISL